MSNATYMVQNYGNDRGEESTLKMRNQKNTDVNRNILASERLSDKVKQPQGDGIFRREVDRVGDATLLKLYGVGGTVLRASTFGYSIFMPGFLIVLAALPPVGHVPLPDVTTCRPRAIT